MADLSDVKYIIEALRNAPAGQHTITPQTGPNSGVQRPAGGSKLGPIEQRRDGYRTYVQEQNANGDTPVSYQEWIEKEE